MARKTKRELTEAILRQFPKSHAEALGVDVRKNTPAPLYQLLIASLLFSSRISANAAENAAKALFKQGWRTPTKMRETRWGERVKVLNRAGYARYDESTARYIGDTTDLLLDSYDGDLRKLREAASRDPGEERKRIKAFKGIGDVGADIFFREVQSVWDEHYPFADRKALAAARKLGLAESPRGLARLVSRKDFPRLLSGLVRLELAGEIGDLSE